MPIIKKGLERLTPNNEKIEKEAGSLKRRLVEGAALATYSFPVGIPIDMLGTGMNIFESLFTRVVSMPVNFLLGKYQGGYEDRVRMALKIREDSSKIKKGLADFVSVGTFQGALYGGIVTASKLAKVAYEWDINELEPEKILRGVGVVFALSLAIGWGYRIVLDKYRKAFDLKGYYKQMKELDNYQENNKI